MPLDADHSHTSQATTHLLEAAHRAARRMDGAAAALLAMERGLGGGVEDRAAVAFLLRAMSEQMQVAEREIRLASQQADDPLHHGGH